MRGPALSPPTKAAFLNQGHVWVMGVLNATPDSFYPDSRIQGLSDAAAKSERMIQEGADLLDIGGESTRPGAAPVSLEAEIDRVLPTLQALRQRWPHIPISIDTQKAEMARQALAHGASLINDISALRHDPEIARVIAEHRCPVVLMHMQGTPLVMQKNPRYTDIMGELQSFFVERMEFALRQGISEDAMILDPGIGFGKSLQHNVTILQRLSLLKALGRPVMIGVSRKSFIGRIVSGSETPPPPEDRLEGTLAATLWGVQEGADGVRVHDVGATRRALQVWQSLKRA